MGSCVSIATKKKPIATSVKFEFPDHGGFFTKESPVFVARAPGRLDVMGGIADYSGSLVAEMPIGQAALCGAQVDPSGKLTIRSLNIGRTVSVATGGEKETERWAVYLAGCVALLKAEGLLSPHAGVRLLLTSDVPLGAGVSSSAAIEVATMRAVTAAFEIALDGLTLARLCQRVENEWVGAPCGVMDQVTSACGEEGKLLLLRCQPHTIEGYTQIPAGWSVFGVDSCVKHSVGGTGYTGVRCAAFMGAKLLGLRPTDYLCNLTPTHYKALGITLPETLSGAAFLEQHGPTWDTVTRVDPAQHYPVLSATEHPIFENQRVETFLAALGAGDFALAGKQMLAAHASYSRCGLGTKETDLLVALAMDQSGVAGAKITGGGSGGTVCILCPSEREAAVAESVAEAYEKHTGTPPRLIHGTSPGALATPVGSL